jgi:hypothetical protein
MGPKRPAGEAGGPVVWGIGGRTLRRRRSSKPVRAAEPVSSWIPTAPRTDPYIELTELTVINCHVACGHWDRLIRLIK